MNLTGRLRFAACTAAVLLGGACFYPAERGKALEARVDRLQDENQELRAELVKTHEQLDAQLPKIDAKIAEVTRALETLDKASRRSDADASVLLQRSVEDIAALRGQLETHQHSLEELRAAITRAQEDTEQKMLTMLGPDAVRAYNERKKLEELQRPTDAKEFLALAQSKATGEPAIARRLYDEFLRKWPKHELTGEAHFGLGEIYFKDDKCREALFEYGKVIQEFTKSKSAPDAYLRSSDCFAKLKMNDEARLALEEVVKSHPKSVAAKSAKTKLAELDRAAKKPAPKKGSK